MWEQALGAGGAWGRVQCVVCGRQEGWFSEMLTKTEPHTSFVDFDFFLAWGFFFFFGGGGLLDFVQKSWWLLPIVPSSLWVWGTSVADSRVVPPDLPLTMCMQQLWEMVADVVSA